MLQLPSKKPSKLKSIVISLRYRIFIFLGIMIANVKTKNNSVGDEAAQQYSKEKDGE